MRAGWYVLGLATIATALPAFAYGIKLGNAAPAYAIVAFDKTRTSSDELRGQVVVINRWATWCGPCKQELPLLDAYYRVHAKDGLRVFAVTTDDSVFEYQLKPLQKVLAIPLVHRLSGGSGFPALTGVPTNYVIDRQGVVRYAKAAAFDERTMNEIIGPLLAEPVPATEAAKTATN